MLKELQPITPVHKSLWHGGFAMLALAALLLAASAYMLLALIPIGRAGNVDFVVSQPTAHMWYSLAYAVGLFFFGPLCNWLVQRYRRGIVCVRATELYAACIVVSWFVFRGMLPVDFFGLVALRFITGAFYALAVMVLLNTLVIDKSESNMRTKANHIMAWLLRFGMVLGPLVAIVVSRNAAVSDVCVWALAAAVIAAVLVRLVHLPFKTPEEDLHHLSADRFLLPGMWRLFFFTCLCFACFGYVLSFVSSVAFYSMMLVGFLWALISERFSSVFVHSDTNLLVAFFFILSAMSVFCSPDGMLPGYFTPCLLGAGIGMAGARAQLMFIDSSGHCRRGTAVTTFLLACESGVAIGLAVGFAIAN